MVGKISPERQKNENVPTSMEYAYKFSPKFSQTGQVHILSTPSYVPHFNTIHLVILTSSDAVEFFYLPATFDRQV